MKRINSTKIRTENRIHVSETIKKIKYVLSDFYLMILAFVRE